MNELELFQLNPLLYILGAIIFGWFLHKNHRKILWGFKEFFWWIGEQTRKMPDMKTHGKQYWVSWIIATILAWMPTFIGVKGLWTIIVYSVVIWVFCFPSLYVLFCRIHIKKR